MTATEEQKSLTPARNDPWCVLMTVAGEQPEKSEIDKELHEKNRRYWNALQFNSLTESEKTRLSVVNHTDVLHEEPLSEDETHIVLKALKDRVGLDSIPSLDEKMEMNSLDFDRPFCCNGFLLRRWLSLRHVSFDISSELNDAVFLGGVSFVESDFQVGVEFERTYFSYVEFHKTRLGHAFFDEAVFGSHTNFLESQFVAARFVDATFESSANFNQAIFLHSADYAHFNEVISTASEFNFSDTVFSSSLSLTNVAFIKESAVPPAFFNTSLHEDTDLSAIIWPPIPHDKYKARFLRRTYEKLKLLMASANKKSDEHMFLRLELRCRESEQLRSISSFISRLYGLCSDYGWSINRPLFLLSLTWLIGGIALWVTEILQALEHPDVPLSFPHSAALSFSNIFSFLGLSRHLMEDEIRSLSSIGEVVSVSQMVVGPFFLFLVILGLRDRYRLP